MPRLSDANAIRDQIGFLRGLVMDQAGASLITDPVRAQALTTAIDDLEARLDAHDATVAPPPDRGLGALAGVGPEAADTAGDTRIPVGVVGYDDTVASERIQAMADLYYLYQHERI